MNELQSFENQAPAQRTTQAEMMISRQTQEVQAAMVIAKRFPRDQIAAYNKVMQACQRPSLAEKAMYEYPRGNEKVTGPSIRLAEAIAQNWGNIDFGIMELEQKNGESQVMAYAWDLETNTRQTKVFAVPHVRNTKKGSYALKDSRDIYELVANQGARRMRACILGVIPGDVVEDAVRQCNKTLEGSNDKPIVDLVRDMAGYFQKEFGVTIEQIEKYIGWKSTSFTMKDIVKLKRVYNSLRDGMAKPTDFFEMAAPVDDKEISDPFGGGKSKEGKKNEAE